MDMEVCNVDKSLLALFLPDYNQMDRFKYTLLLNRGKKLDHFMTIE